MNGLDIVKLAELLKPNNDDSDFEDDQKCKTNSTKSDLKRPTTVRAQENTIVERETDAFSSENESITDWKKCPQWDIVYKQSVSPSDVYLQMSGKTQLTASCEEMVITVNLPGESMPSIDVKVTKDHLKILSLQFHLSVPLPHPVDPKLGNAKWDPTSEKLTLTLKMDREFDYINF